MGLQIFICLLSEEKMGEIVETQMKLEQFWKSLPANEVGQGIVFTGVCQSTGAGGGWLPSMHHRSHDRGEGVCILSKTT